MVVMEALNCLKRMLTRPPVGAAPVPALPVEQSVTENFLVCLETGTRHVVLRRHLAETLGMSPAEYRARWNLPDSYPMTAAIYEKRRRAVRRHAGADR